MSEDMGTTTAQESTPIATGDWSPLIAELRQARDIARAAEAEATANLDKAQRRLDKVLAASIGIAVGDIVESKDRKGNTRRYRVTQIRMWDYRSAPSAWLSGNPQLKDGTFGALVRRVGEPWTKVAHP